MPSTVTNLPHPTKTSELTQNCADHLLPLPPSLLRAKVEFSREVLGKGAGLPPARAFYALEVLLCAVGKEAGMGTTLLVDYGVGVLAARGRVMKFTFVQVHPLTHLSVTYAFNLLVTRRESHLSTAHAPRVKGSRRGGGCILRAPPG